MDTIKIGKILRDLRGDRPQREVAEAIGVTTMALSQYENGNRVPRDEIKISLAKFYGVTVESIFYT